MNLLNLINGDVEEQEFLNYHNANVTYTSLPKGIHGFVFQYFGIYNIFINENISNFKQKYTLLHELVHVMLNQLDQTDKDLYAFKIKNYEDEADRYVELLLESRSEYDD